MQNIYDQAKWPPPENNPLIQLLRSGEEWFSNEQVAIALGLSPRRSLVCNQTTLVRQLREEDTAIESRSWLIPTKSISASHGGTVRLLSRRGVILAAIRVNTVNAAAFRDWLADQVAGEVTDAQA